MERRELDKKIEVTEAMYTAWVHYYILEWKCHNDPLYSDNQYTRMKEEWEKNEIHVFSAHFSPSPESCTAIVLN